jgi:hypothetical protein
VLHDESFKISDSEYKKQKKKKEITIVGENNINLANAKFTAVPPDG